MGKERNINKKRRVTAQSFCRMKERLDFARQMVDAADDLSKAQDVFAFFCYFVAFNILYSWGGEDDEGHYHAVKRFLGREYASQCVAIHPGNDAAFPALNGKVGKGNRVIDQKFGNENTHIESETNADIKVFLRILQIRNNLFHGSKDLNDHRDMPLIREANIVLRRFLLDYFERKKSDNTTQQNIKED